MLRRLVVPSFAALIAAGGLYVTSDSHAVAAAGGPAGQEAFTPREVTPADIPPTSRRTRGRGCPPSGARRSMRRASASSTSS